VGRRLFAGWTFLFALSAVGAAAQVRLPAPVGYINDFANVIPANVEAQIQQIIDEVRTKSGGEIVVVTLPSLEGRTRDEVACRSGVNGASAGRATRAIARATPAS
jgi:uncharacterized membrane protein YgcG